MKERKYTGLEIAVIGMAVKFPGADNVTEFWKNLKNSKESISFFTKEQIKDLGVKPEVFSNPNFVPAGGVLESKDSFDSNFFGYRPE